MSQYIQIPDNGPVETQSALEYYDTTYTDIIGTTLNILAGQRQLLFDPSAQWFEALEHAITHAFPPLVSSELIATAKWTVIDEYLPSTVLDSHEARSQATVDVITTFIDEFAQAHHNAIPDQRTTPNEDTTLDRWV